MNWRHFFIMHAWWGKILGGFFGYLTGGPVGALFGILVGNFFDKGLVTHLINPLWLYIKEQQNQTQQVFFESTFAVMGYLAKADGQVTEQEVTIARQFMKDMRLTKEQQHQAKQLFNAAKASDFKIDSILIALKYACKNKPDLLRLFVDIQLRAAQVDGLSAAKIQVLNKVFSSLGFTPFSQQYSYQGNQNHSDTKQQPYQSTNALALAYSLLAISSQATKQEVKRAYRRAISKNHPDKLVAQGLSQTKIKMANDKTQQIVKAYTLICESKGW